MSVTDRDRLEAFLAAIGGSPTALKRRRRDDWRIVGRNMATFGRPTEATCSTSGRANYGTASSRSSARVACLNDRAPRVM